eukprot:TRINITY_DN3578_c0_g1_i1.p1 TRINITY_DN3578_c0_g1~~TRINITY_DN3578_c0_g1_i1.p1  ORF type:complete len:328 (-),score=99.46 TRINITY_DN3578_c0_g1_i1:166-1149(-)
MVKVAVCGAAGGIGQPLSLLLKQQLPSGSSLAIYDVVRPILGVGEDLSHISSNVKLSIHLGDMQNPNNAEVDKALHAADVVIIPAGVPRKPGMTRDDLFKVNAGIVRGLIEAVARNCPKALVGIITNPVNSTVPVAAEVLKKHGVYDPKRLFGVSTLDITRAKTFIGEAKGLDPTQVQVDVIGGHSPETMLTVLSQVKGVTFSADETKALSTKIKEAGTAVVNAKEGAGSATLSMAYAGAHFALALVRGLKGESNVVEDSYVDVSGVQDEQLQGVQFLALPVLLGPHGVEKILGVPQLDESEKAQLKELIPVVKKNIETGVHFVNGA